MPDRSRAVVGFRLNTGGFRVVLSQLGNVPSTLKTATDGDRRPIYQQVTDRIVAAFERGGISVSAPGGRPGQRLVASPDAGERHVERRRYALITVYEVPPQEGTTSSCRISAAESADRLPKGPDPGRRRSPAQLQLRRE